ncbi:discoidin domain-containing protein [Motilibacter rhizosphaerae]|uniref:discoidin domain-containing protein n=1 Tax=Motilibacter rhizosphaerae TaxID=598652 RepID=UPI001E403F36|nr:discoidin domain-containing protein [Motilibacter rhizosphaerae]
MDFLKASGHVLKTNAGTGKTINLRGTNVGGWLTQEDWMSPLGEFALDRTGWSATASSGPAENVLDGSRSTVWSTGASQSGGEWLRIDLGATTFFDRLSVDDSASPGQYARNLDVETSKDGSAWTSVANQPGAEGVTTVRFALQAARYLRVTQTGDAAVPWSVSELNLFDDPTLHPGSQTATASSSSVNTSPSMAVDGNPSTVWQTGTPQVPGQSITVDLGRVVAADKVLFDSGADTANDYPRSWQVATSEDGSTFVQAASGYGHNRVIQADFQGFKYPRYLRITSTGTADQWWSIAEIAVSTGTTLDRSGWVATATGGDAPVNALDGDVNTRWTTGTAQTAGQKFQVDMGALTTLNDVAIDTAKNTTSEGDWARGFTLELSRDGTTWTTAATGAGTFKATNISFPAQAARYLRLTQTGSALQWWSIGELTAGLYNDDYNLNTTLTQRFGVTGAQAVIDAHRDTWLQTSDLDSIKAAGLNYIRVPIGWNTFLNLDGTWKASPWDRLDWVVREASSRGIYVLLDLHTVPGGGCSWASCGRVGPSPNSFWGTPRYQDQVDDIWKAMASRYAGNPGVAGYDLINEPLVDPAEDAADIQQKNDYFNRLYKTVRAVDPDHVVVMPAFLGADSVAKPATYGWTNVMYEFHPYDMSGPKDWTAQDNLVTNELAAIPDRFAAFGAPLLVGEFSLYYNDDEWARFMAGLNAASVSWSNWAYKVKGAADDGFAYWGQYYDDPQPVPIVNSDDQATFTAKLRQFDTSRFHENTGLVGVIKQFSGGRSAYAPKVVSHDGWTATASSTATNSSPAWGIDGTNGAGWYSGRNMTGDEWYEIDMGAAQSVAMITVQTPTASVDDYPRGFDIEVSTNGVTWTRVATGAGYGWKRPIATAPSTARFIRIAQTGSAPQWWSIDDVTVYSSY